MIAVKSSDSARQTGAAVRRSARWWWVVPTISCLVTGCLWLLSLLAYAAAAMSADSCNRAADCPHTFAHIHRGEFYVVAGIILAGVQWVPAYWLPRIARWMVASVPPTLMVAATIILLNTPAGR